MSGEYFGRARRDVFPWLPENCGRLLEIGCGAGATLAAIRDIRSVSSAIGVEPDAASAAKAGAVFDRIFHATVEAAPVESAIAPGSLDVILCLDVLEHLVDPWATVRRLTPLLAPGGRLVVSLPNIRNWKFIARLLFGGNFRYVDAGLLDRTHLRFFTRETAIELVECGGLKLSVCADAKQYTPFEFRSILLKLTGGALSGLVAKQYILVAGR